MKLSPWQLRVVHEHLALCAKKGALYSFILSDKFIELPLEDQNLMVRQHWFMDGYASTLAKRVDRFPKD